MNKGRVEAFSDGVLAIIITIMVLGISAPQGDKLSDLTPIIPAFLSYILSFIYVGIYWNNHHHMMQTVEQVSGGILWANLHFLFWLSLIPFVTSWMGKNNFSAMPMFLYGIVLLMTAMAYVLFQAKIIKSQGVDSLLAKAVGKDYKGKASLILYLMAMGACWISSWIAGFLYMLVALIWLIPDKRIEKILTQS